MVRASNFTTEELQILIIYLESNPHLITGELPYGKQKSEIEKDWQEIANLMNSSNRGQIRTPIQVKNKWADWKIRVKRKAQDLRSSFNQTGGGPPSKLMLTEQEERILQLIGKTSVEGIADSSFDSSSVLINVPCSSTANCQEKDNDQSKTFSTSIQEMHQNQENAIEKEANCALEEGIAQNLENLKTPQSSQKWNVEKRKCSSTGRSKRRRMEEDENKENKIIDTQSKTYECLQRIETQNQQIIDGLTHLNLNICNLTNSVNTIVQLLANALNIPIAENQ